LTRRGHRLSLIAVALAVVGAAAAIALYALRDNIVFFLSPTEVVEKAVQPGARLRVGGLVKADSLIKHWDENVTFVVTDGVNEVKVAYQGLLPDLFREGQGVVAEGVLDKLGEMRAETILAKHDERYMPREVVEALKKQGRWREGDGVAKP
jgi:cytochrome c-type biogenesis protein CcmE